MEAINLLTRFIDILPDLQMAIQTEENQPNLDTIRKLCMRMSHIDFAAIAASAENQLCRIELVKPKYKKTTLYNSRNLAKMAVESISDAAVSTQEVPCAPYPTWPLCTINTIEDVSIPEVVFPVAGAPHLIPMPFYLLEGKKGLYMRLTNNVVCRVPFPNLYTADNKEFKRKSVKCRFNDQELCANYRKQMSRINRTQTYPCSFAHSGEKFNRVGFAARCRIASFGNHDALADDLARVQLDDIKHMLMNILNDLLLVNIWMQTTCRGTLVLDDLDVC